jgi:NitT/TauT family transport system permease protein
MPGSEKNLKRIGMGLLSHIAFVIAWHVIVVAIDVPEYILPTPLAALESLGETNYNWLKHAWVTTAEIFGGYLLAVVFGVGVALLFTWVPMVNSALMPLFVTINMVPKVAMAPLFIVWLSYGIGPNIIIAFTICFFPILLTTVRGLNEVEPDLIDLVKALKGSRLQIFAKIQLPGSLPYVFSGMKVAAVLAVAGAIVGEFIASDSGLGYFLLIAQENLDTAAMVMALIFISFIGMALYGLVLLLEAIVVVKDARVE